MKNKKLKKAIQYEIFLLPAFIAFTLFTIIPLVKTIMYSVTDFNGISHEYNFVGLKNFIGVFKDQMMRHSLFNTIFYTFCTMILIQSSCYSTGSISGPKYKNEICRTCSFFSIHCQWPFAWLYLGLYSLPNENSALNTLLAVFGAGPIGFTATEWGAKISIILVAVWTSTGWYATIYLAYLQAIPNEYYEAAAIDGASRWQQFTKITFPLLAPGLTVNTLLLLTNGLKVYDLPYALTKGGPGYSNYTVTQVIIQRGLSEKQYGASTALATIFIIIVALIAGIQYMAMSKREEDIS